jgi:hypothetical protein
MVGGKKVRELLCPRALKSYYSAFTLGLVFAQETYLRTACARSRERPMEVIGEALRTISASDAEGFFEHSGYRAVIQSL